MTRILDIVDMQGDFMSTSGKLYVPNSDVLVARTNDFFRALPKRAYDVALFKYDTHFDDEYKVSPENGPFPDIHCEYATPGWELVVDPSLLDNKTDVYYMTVTAGRSGLACCVIISCRRVVWSILPKNSKSR